MLLNLREVVYLEARLEGVRRCRTVVGLLLLTSKVGQSDTHHSTELQYMYSNTQYKLTFQWWISVM